MWCSGEQNDSYLNSATLMEGENAELGSSLVTISYLDVVTGAKTDVLFAMEILTRARYKQYERLGLTDYST